MKKNILALTVLALVALLCSCPTKATKPAEPAYIAEVGDIVYADKSISHEYESTKEPIGMVCEVKNGKATKVLNFSYAAKKFTAESNGVCFPTSDDDGSLNWAAICEVDSSATIGGGAYPAWDYVHSLPGTSFFSWYIPSINELKALYEIKDVINEVFGTLFEEYTGLFDSTWIWSSSQNDESAGGSYSFQMKIWSYSQFAYNAKLNEYLTISIAKFE